MMVRSRHLRVWLSAGVAVLLIAAVASAYWSAGSTGGSAGAAAAATVNQGATPTASASTTVGRTVTVSWGASTLSNGQAVDGYLVKRYDAGSLAQQTTLAGCAGTIRSLSCTETGVPPGTWEYAITPVIGTNWQGAESTKSGTVTVAAAALALTKTVFGAPLPGMTGGSLSGFAPNEGLSFRLDSSVSIAGSPSTVDASGNASITGLTVPSGTADGAHTVYALGNFSPAASQASAGIVVDTTPPTVGVSLSPAANGAGWNSASPVTVTLSPADGAGSGVKQVKYTTDGTDPTTSGTAQVYAAPFTVGGGPPVANQTVTVRYYATDNAGNSSAVQTQTVKLDTVAPSDSVSLSGVTGGAYLTGSTLYYNGNTSGSFTLSNALTDAGGSGAASTGYAALSGPASNWSFTSSNVTSGPPYISNTFGWTPGTTAPTETVTGVDVAGNSASQTLTLTPDTTGPTGGSLTVNGGSVWNTSGSYTVASTNYNADAGSGVKSNSLTVQVGTLAGGACSGFGTATAASTGPQTEPTGCYLYTLTGTDNVGNISSISTTVKVDTTAPSTPTPTLSAATGSTFINGSTVYINPQTGNSGGFTVTSSPTDPDSGIASVTYPTPTGFTSGGATITSSPFTTTYSWTGAVGAAGSQTITATNGAGNTSTSTFTISPDTAAPSGGSISYAASTNVASPVLTLTNGTDSGSGISAAGGTALRAATPMTNNTCGTTYGGFSTLASGITSGSYIDVTPAGGACYKYEYQISDNVGNNRTYASSNVVTMPLMPKSLSVTNNGNDVPDPGDTLALSYNEPVNGSSICSTGLTGTSGTVSETVTLTKSNGATTIGVGNCSNIGTLSLSSVYVLGSNGATMTFTSSAISLSSSGVLTITLGSVGSGSATNGMPGTITWSASTSTRDTSGNALVPPSTGAITASPAHSF